MAFSIARPRALPRYILASILVSFGGLLFGLDTGTIGPLTTMPQFLDYVGNMSSTVHGLLVSSILIPASLTSFFTGSVADRIGRVTTISLGGVIFSLGTALEAAAQDLAMLFVGRCITGVGEGLFLSTMSVYIVEIAPAKERGVLASVQQLLISSGICAGYFVCYGTVRIVDSSVSWRLPFAIHSVLACSYGISVYLLLPESPRWLKERGKYEQAAKCWERLGLTGSDVEKEGDKEKPQQQHISSDHLAEAGSQHHQHHHHRHRLSIEPIHSMEAEGLALAPMRSRTSVHGEPSSSSQGSWFRLFAPDVRTRTLLGAFLSGMQQLAGIDGVLYYAPILFKQAGLASSQASFLASGVSALLMLVVTIPAFLFADKWGRRTSILTGGCVLTLSMFTIGALYAADAVHADHGAGRWVVVVLIFVFALAFSVSWAVHVRIYASEIQPLATRAPATSLAQTSNWIVNFLVALTTPIFLAHSSFGVYFLFGGASLATVGVCACFMPETKGKTLEEIEEAFTKKSKKKRGSAGGGSVRERVTRLAATGKGTEGAVQRSEEEHEL